MSKYLLIQIVFLTFALGIVGSHDPMTRAKLAPPFPFLRGQGYEMVSKMSKRSTTEDFARKSRLIFGDEYLYDKVNYVNSYTDVLIGCRKHGYFLKIPTNHLRGQGCPTCANIAKAQNQKNRPKSRNMLVCGVGINDYCGVIKDENGKTIAPYRIWQHALCRCYNDITQRKRPTYVGCSVCDEWLSFKAFKAWFDDPANGYMEGYHLDKDVLVLGNKVYSPNTCCFLPNEINAIFTKRNSDNKALPVGVTCENGKYLAQISCEGHPRRLGLFSTSEDAFAAYKVAKEANIKEVAEKYYREGKITERVYNALINYKVEITD